MTKALKLQLVTGATSPVTIEFDVEGQLLPKWTPVYTLGGSPRQIVYLNLEWIIRGARVQADDASDLWDASSPLGKLIAALKARGSEQIVAAYLKDANDTTLDSITLSEFRNIVVAQVEGAPDPTLPHEAWNRSAFLTITISAERVTPEAGTGIVVFEQKIIDKTGPDGLRDLTYITNLEVDESTDVTDDAVLAYCRIPAAALDSYSMWQTNASTGVDITLLDADEHVARVPHKAIITSHIIQSGSLIGGGTPAAAPGMVEFTVYTESNPSKTKVTTRAKATGPNARQWVEGNGHKPAVFTSEIINDAEHANEYAHTWIYEVGVEETIRLESSGGYQPVRWEPLAAALYPMKFTGAFVPLKVEVDISIRKTAQKKPTRAEMVFPGILPAPWYLDRSSAVETEPYYIGDGVWERRAHVTYYAGAVPDDASEIENALVGGFRVKSYKYGTFDPAANNELGGVGNFGG